MASKIVRDLNKKGSLVISLKDGVPAKRKEKDSVDISAAGKGKFVITKSGGGGVKDVKSEGSKSSVFFFQIDPAKEKKLDRINEIIRLAAAGIAILFVINLVNVFQRGVVIKDQVVASAYSGYEDLMKAGEHAKTMDFSMAGDSFSGAEKGFQQAMTDIAFLQTSTDVFFAKEKTVNSVQNILEAGKNISLAGADFSKGIEDLKQMPFLFMNANVNPESRTATGKPSLTEMLKKDFAYVEEAVTAVEAADNNLSGVSPDVLPEQFKDKLRLAQGTVKKIRSVLESAREKIPALLEMLGDRYIHRYLILLQNDTEARPTGGFIGSFMIVDVNDGYITKTEFHDVYEYDGQLNEDIPAPEDIAQITKNWRLRDSNYSPDFTYSAKKADWFLQKEKGPSVDTIIAVNQSMIADLLDITGPVKIDSLNASLDSSNYQIVLSYIIESKLNGSEKPKEILGEFISAFRKQLFTSGNWQKIITALIKAVKTKSIMLYSKDAVVQQLFDKLDLSGRVIQTKPNEDYLNVTVTSVGGNKSDIYVKQAIQHDTIVNNTGLLIDELTIKREHTWSDKSLEKVKSIIKSFGFDALSDVTKNILGAGINKSYIKVYVPLGSKLLDVSGIKPEDVKTREDDEINKTYFIFTMDVAAGQSKEVKISYQLPQNLNLLPVDTYRLYVQRQPGIYSGYFAKQIFFKPGLKGYEQYPAEMKKYESGNLYYEGNLEKDLYLSAVVGS
jgi:hypothetical protein